MGRSNGYRPKKAVKEEVMRLRAKLGELNTQEWAQAQVLMNHITALMNVKGGPEGAMIIPRACRYCGYYGHTKQFCKKRIEKQRRCYDLECDKLLAEDVDMMPTEPKDERALRFDAIEERMWEGVRRELGPKEPSEHERHCDCAECREWDEWMAPVRYAGEPKPQFYGVSEERSRWLVELWERANAVK